MLLACHVAFQPSPRLQDPLFSYHFIENLSGNVLAETTLHEPVIKMDIALYVLPESAHTKTAGTNAHARVSRDSIYKRR